MFSNQIKIKTQLFLLVSFIVVVYVINGLIYFKTLETVKIKGPYYEEIITIKNVIMDLETKLDTTKAYLLAFEQANETDPQELEILIHQSQSFHDEFEKKFDAWMKNSSYEFLKEIDSDIKDKLQRYEQEFFEIWKHKFLPAVRNKDKEEVQALLDGPMKIAYQGQMRAIKKAEEILNKHNMITENEVEKVSQASYAHSLWLRLISLIIIIFFAYLIGRSITRRLNQATQKISAVSGQICSNVTQQTKEITQQSSSVHETTAAMDELNASFQQTQLLAQDSSHRAKEAFKISEEGQRSMKEMLDQILKHKEKVLAILNQILHFNEIVSQIHTVASTINNLTNQTNMLALNAAVQAAHVKQNVEGFSVIAAEIRKLADESKKFVSHIDLLAENIQHATNATVRLAEEGNQTVEGAIKLAHSSNKAFETIISITTNSSEAAEQVSLNVEQQSQAVHQVLEAMEMLNESASESLMGITNVKAELEKLNTLSQELKSII